MGELINSENKKCIFVIGPTASGKSAWALEQAQKYSGSIINIDSIQLYEDLIIGSAAPSEIEKNLVPHYLYNYVKAPKEMTAGDYIHDFYELLKTSVRFPLFIVGGTGFYIQALERGMYDIEKVPDDLRKKIEDELSEHGPARLFDELKKNDPESKIHINDHFRLVRAIEIIRYTGKIPSKLKSETSYNKNLFPFEYIKVGFDFEKSELKKRVEKRTKFMLDKGLTIETQKIIDRGFEPWAPLGSVGYKETVEYLKGNLTKEELPNAINLSTLQLIKKQKTWFKRDKSILWSNQEESLKQFLS